MKIRPGYKWLPNIDQAISRARLAVLLVSEYFLASKFIKAKELPPLLAAAEGGACSLLPILLRASGYDRAAISEYQFCHDPAWPLDDLEKPNKTWVEICRRIRCEAEAVWGPHFDRELSAQAAPALIAVEAVAAGERLGELHGIPEQKPNFLAREELDTLIQALLASTTAAVGVTGRPLGLHGMGGIGKTELAAALCRDDRVQRAFPDGLFWLTLGQSPDQLIQLTELACFAGVGAPHFASVVQAQEALRQHFRNRACLLVLDDLWRIGDARDLAVLGRRGRTLITTRDAGLLTALTAEEVALNVLSPALSLKLLSAWSEKPEPLPAEASEVVEECGRLPLALALAGARVHDGAPWADVRTALKAGDLEFLDHPHGSVFKSLRMSVNALLPDVRARYGELAVFPKHVPIPVPTVERLWRHTSSLDDYESRRLLTTLARQGLLALEAKDRHLGFHDLQQDFLKLDSEDLQALHTSLVEAYRPTSGSWADLPTDESYLWRWLAWHLLHAGRDDELKTVLFDPAWLRTKLVATDVNSLITDCDLLVGDEDARLVRHALTLSAHVLTKDKAQLAGQLAGRLRAIERPAISQLTDRIECNGNGLRLVPQTASLTPAGGALLRTLEGHESEVSSVAILPDGRRALSGSADRTLKVWDLETGEAIRTLRGHAKAVNAVAVFADGRRALSGSDDGTLKLWDLDTGGEIATFEGHAGQVNTIAVLANGRRAISGSDDGAIKLWHLERGETIRTLAGHCASVTAVAVSADGQRALSGSADRMVKLWDLETGGLIRTFAGHQDIVAAVALLPDDRRALSASWDLDLSLWDLETGIEIRRFAGHQRALTAISVLPDGRVLTASRDKALKLWDLEAGAVLRSFVGHQDWVNAVAVLPDPRRALSASDDATLKLWDLEVDGERREAPGHTREVTALALFRDRQKALSGSADGSLFVWSLTSYEPLSKLTTFQHEVRLIVALPDNRRALVGGSDGTIKIWDLERGKAIRRFSGRSIRRLTILPDGRRALSPASGSIFRLWDIETGRTTRTLLGPEGAENLLAVLPDGQTALSGSAGKDRELKLWDLKSGSMVRTFEIYYVSAAAVFPDARRLLSASFGTPRRPLGTLCLWDLDTGTQLRAFDIHEDFVEVVSVLPDGRQVLSAGKSGILKLWDVKTGEAIRTLEGHAAGICSISPLPDGRRALSASRDGTLKLWDLETGEVIRTLHSFAVLKVVALVDGRRAFSYDGDSGKWWDLETGTVIRTLQYKRADMRAMAMLPDRRTALATMDGSALKLWDLESGETIRFLAGSGGADNVVAILRDGYRVLSVLDDCTLELWNLETGETLSTLTSHKPCFSRVALLPDEHRVLSMQRDAKNGNWTLRLWDLERGKAINSLDLTNLLKMFPAGIDLLTLLPKADRIFVSKDQTLCLCDRQTGEPLANFSIEASVTCIAAPRDDLLIAGDATGVVHMLKLLQ